MKNIEEKIIMVDEEMKQLQKNKNQNNRLGRERQSRRVVKSMDRYYKQIS